jgi:hypothetical protein
MMYKICGCFALGLGPFAEAMPGILAPAIPATAMPARRKKTRLSIIVFLLLPVSRLFCQPLFE